MDERLERVRLMLGEEQVEKLKHAAVLVAGVGGVGSYAAEGLARSGVGRLILIDKDTVALSNLNRQIMAVQDTVGQGKCEAMKARIESYSGCQVTCVQAFLDASNLDWIRQADFAVDAIDTVTSKLDFVEACHHYGVPFVCSLGMGNRLDPSRVRCTELAKTSGDPLARAVRAMARKRGIDYPVPVLFSDEPPVRQNEVVDPEGKTRKDRIPPASMIFVPAAAGLLAASVAVRTLIQKENA